MTMPQTPPTIRPAQVADVDAIFHIRTSVRENTLSMQALADLGITPASIRETIATQPCMWVAEVAGQVRGFAMIDQEDACLFAVFVLPAFEGMGLGKGLVQVAEAALFAQHPSAWLETDRHSRAAGFYQSLGWHYTADAGAGDVRLEKQRPSI